MDFISSWKNQLVGHWSNMLDDIVRPIKHGWQLVVFLGFEIFFLVRFEPKKHMITFLKNNLWMTLVPLLLHALLVHVEFIIHSWEGGCTQLKHCINWLDLWCSLKIASDCRWALATHYFIWGHVFGCMIGSIVPPFYQGDPLHPLILFVWIKHHK